MSALTPTDLPAGRAGDQEVRHLGQVLDVDPPSIGLADRNGKAILPPRAASRNVGVESVCRRRTISAGAFGISTPIALLPGSAR